MIFGEVRCIDKHSTFDVEPTEKQSAFKPPNSGRHLSCNGKFGTTLLYAEAGLQPVHSHPLQLSVVHEEKVPLLDSQLDRNEEHVADATQAFYQRLQCCWRCI